MLVFVCYGSVTISYHDATSQSFAWGGAYRGTWFHAEDFVPAVTGYLVESVELWFYHSPDFPWDTPQFYVELWNGGAGWPTQRLIQVEATALEQPSATVVYFDPPVEVEPDFWCIVSTEFSSGGWPSVLVDATPSGHSFYADSYTLWEQYSAGDYFVSVCFRETGSSVSGCTWGTLKAVFVE